MAGLLPCDTQSCFLLGHVLQLLECSAHFVKVNSKLRLRILVRNTEGIQAFILKTRFFSIKDREKMRVCACSFLTHSWRSARDSRKQITAPYCWCALSSQLALR